MQPIYTTYRNRQMLADVVIMRIGLIFLLIGTHSFAPYSVSWETLSNMKGIEDIPLYKYISPFTHFISMPALIFLSGYLFGHSWEKSAKQPFWEFVYKKIKRLIIPSIIFSCFYYYFFYDSSESIFNITYDILNGTGHLWFLPMLFWCFVFSYLLHKLNISRCWIFAGLVLLALLPLPILPFRISTTFTYLIYFYLGSVLMIDKDSKINVSLLYLILLTLAYIFLNFILPEMKLPEKASLVGKILYIFSIKSIKMLLSLSGIGIAFIATRIFLSRQSNLSGYFIILSTYCYGVYIFHQFILKYIYYYTAIPEKFHPAVLPFITYIITLLISLSITSILLKYRTGRKLIG